MKCAKLLTKPLNKKLCRSLSFSPQIHETLVSMDKASDLDNKQRFSQAIVQGDQPKLEECFSNGTGVNSRIEKNLTPLMMAVMNKNHDSVNLLIKSGALLHEKDDFGRTALDLAKQVKCGPIQDALLAAEASSYPAMSLMHDAKSIE
jgi:ankyrin repeat protein